MRHVALAGLLILCMQLFIGCKSVLDRSNSTDEWAMYSSDKYRLTLQHPSDWHHQQGGFGGFRANGEEFRSPDNLDNFVISQPNSSFASFKGGIESYPYSPITLTDIQTVTVHGKRAAFGTATKKDGEEYSFYFIPRGYDSFFIYYNKDSAEISEKIFETIVFDEPINESINGEEFINSCSSNALLSQYNFTGADSSDWRTYINKDHQFSFSYPPDWGKVVLNKYNDANKGFVGRLLGGVFENTDYKDGIISNTISFGVWSDDFSTLYDERNEFFDFSTIDMNKSQEELAETIKLHYTKVMQVEKIKIGNNQVLKLHEYGSLHSQCFERYHYLIPDFNDRQDNLSITSGLYNLGEVDDVINTLTFTE